LRIGAQGDFETNPTARVLVKPAKPERRANNPVMHAHGREPLIAVVVSREYTRRR
jgi:hypothetical protein